MTQALRIFDKYNRDVSDDFDADGILKDKHSVRVPLTMKDSAGNVVKDTKHKHGVAFTPEGKVSHTWSETEEEDSVASMQDALDYMSAAKAKRDAQIRDSARIKDEARAEMIKDMANEWKNKPEDDLFERALAAASGPDNDLQVEVNEREWKVTKKVDGDARDAAWQELQQQTKDAWKETQ